MTISDVKIEFQSELHNIYPINEISAILGLLFSDIGISHYDIACNTSQLISKEHEQYITQALQQLSQHKPIQYIRGKADFYGLEFMVNEHVLIPRQETEILVNTILQQQFTHTATIVDIGTGSGCIAVTLATHLPLAQVFAIDISPLALDIAAHNATLHNATITCIEADMCDPQVFGNIPLCSCIVSNPPYVCTNEKKQMELHVLDYEPHTALFVSDDNPLLYYEALAKIGMQKLISQGMIVCEINEAFGQETCALFEQHGYTNCLIIKDLHEKDRFVQAYKP